MPTNAPRVIRGRGGALPTNDREQQVQKPSLTARYDSGYIRDISAAASSRNKDLEDLGDALGKGLHVAGKCVDDYYRGQVNLITSEYKRQMNEMTDGKDGYMSRLGESAFNLDHEYGLEAQRRKAQLLKGKSRYVQGMVDVMTKDFDSQHSIRLQQHSMSEFRKYTQAGQNAAIGDALDTMKGTSDIAEFRQNLAMVQYQTTQKYRDMGLSGDALDRAVRMDVSKAMGEAIQAKLSQGDQAGAEMLYSLYGGGTTPESKFMGLAGNSGLAPGNGRTIAEACRNPLNLKKPGANKGDRSDFQVFRNYAEGYVGCWRQLQRYQTKNQLFTPRAMIARWAPASDGNDQRKYTQVVSSFGIDVDAPIDMSDPRQAALLLKAMSTMEGPVGNMFTSAEIYQMITTGRMPAGREEPAGGPGAAVEAGTTASPGGGAAGGMDGLRVSGSVEPSTAGASPSGGGAPADTGERQIRGAGLMLPDDDAKIARSLEMGRENARRKAEADRKQAEKDMAEYKISQGYEQVRRDLDNSPYLTKEDKTARIMKATSEEAMPNLTSQERDTLRKQLAGYVVEQDNQKQATDALAIGTFNRTVMQNDKLSLREKRNVVLQTQFSPEAKQYLCNQIDKIIEGTDNKQQSSADLMRFMMEYDRRAQGMTEGEAATLAMQFNLNAADWDKAMSYRGKRIEYPMGRINTLIDRALGKDVPNMERADIWETVLKVMGDQHWDNNQIENWLRQSAALDRRHGSPWYHFDESPSECKTLLEFYAHGTEGLFRPEISPMTKDVVTRELERTVTGWETLKADARDILITNQILLNDYGITPRLYPEEEQILRREKLWPLTRNNS